MFTGVVIFLKAELVVDPILSSFTLLLAGLAYYPHMASQQGQPPSDRQTDRQNWDQEWVP
jgi:hypothetical protein